MTRRLFFAAYAFPPRLAGGTFRAVKLVKYLPEFFSGEIHVLTTPPASEAGDAGLEADIAGRCTVHRVAPAGDPREWKVRLRQRARGGGGAAGRAAWRGLDLAYRPLYSAYSAVKPLFLFPDGKLFWSLAVARYLETLNPGPEDLLLTTCPERSLLVAGARFKARHPDVPWVVDFRDGWFAHPFNFHSRNPVRIAVEGRLERQVFRRADRVVCATDIIEEVYRERYPWAADKLTTIFNGYDPEDFQGLEPRQLDPAGFHLVYTGSAGRMRTTDSLLAAVRAHEAGAAEGRQPLHVHFVGPFLEGREGWQQALGERAHFHGRVPHRDALRFMLGADLLLVLLQEGEGGITAYTGKIFEYIRAGAPILVIGPPSGAERLVRSHDLGYAAGPDDVAAIRLALDRANSAAGSEPRQAPAALLGLFDRRKQAEQMAAVLAAAGAAPVSAGKRPGGRGP